jgi:hypothetical protein
MSDARAHLALSGIPFRYWHFAVRHACAVRCKLASQEVLDDSGDRRFVSPDELFFGRQPDLRHLRAFGSPCRVLLLGPERVRQGKLGLPSARGRVLGYGGDGVQIDNTYRLLLGYVVLLDTGRIVYSRHVQIDERSLVEVRFYASVQRGAIVLFGGVRWQL